MGNSAEYYGGEMSVCVCVCMSQEHDTNLCFTRVSYLYGLPVLFFWRPKTRYCKCEVSVVYVASI
jgi:hypothetical protein